jgi:hypothetical protein
MPPFIPVLAISRSQNIRIGNAQGGATGNRKVGQIQDTVAGVTPVPFYVDLGDGPSRRDLAHHSALGAIIIIGALSATGTDFTLTSGGVVSAGTGMTVNVTAGVLTQSSPYGSQTVTTLAATGLLTPAPTVTAGTSIAYQVVAQDAAAGADAGDVFIIAGAPATTGTQVTPGVPGNCVALASVVVPYGASSIISGYITAGA